MKQIVLQRESLTETGFAGGKSVKGKYKPT